ncbi:MAG: glycine betaine ABC transporter substrate-binding protein [Longimicrobiales bacterium]|nr:glycine betaine ABC transporter substrate-binding protein [Longimicrobiales bacterium]
MNPRRGRGSASLASGARRHGRGRLAILVLLALPGILVGQEEGVPAERALEGARSAPLRPVIVASKPFAESFLLAELFAQRLEAVGFAVDRRPGLGATEIAFQALRTGAIDLYPEYTGTGLTAILDLEPEGSADEVYALVARRFRDLYGVDWLPPLGFENSYAIAVRPRTADSLGLSTLSDLVAVAPRLVAGFSPDFIGRPDGLPGLVGAYAVEFSDTRPLLQSIKYEALVEGAVDLIDGYTTDGAIDRYGLVVLTDDADFFPPYEAAALLRPGLAAERPGVVSALVALSGRISEERMRSANRRVEVEGAPVVEVAADLLAELGLAGAGADPARARSRTTRGGTLAYLWASRHDTLRQTGRHLWLVGVALLAAILLAVPGGVLLARTPRVAEPVVRAVGVLQTLPSIALLAFMIPLLGIGVGPAIVALFLYALFPILRNTWSGIRDADPEAIDAAHALGMTHAQILLQVRLPLAAPVVMAGIRVSAVIAVGTATLAAFIGAGGLGDPIVAGLALSDERMILAGAIPAAVLALAVDAALSLVESAVRPRGLREE